MCLFKNVYKNYEFLTSTQGQTSYAVVTCTFKPALVYHNSTLHQLTQAILHSGLGLRCFYIFQLLRRAVWKMYCCQEGQVFSEISVSRSENHSTKTGVCLRRPCFQTSVLKQLVQVNVLLHDLITVLKIWHNQRSTSSQQCASNVNSFIATRGRSTSSELRPKQMSKVSNVATSLQYFLN